MRTAAVFATAASLLSLASARINGFAVPSTIKPDDDITIRITTEGYIQSVQEVAISFGISPANTSYPGSLGPTLLSSKFLGPGKCSAIMQQDQRLTESTDLSNTDGNITHYVHIPSDLAKGPAVLQAGLFSLYGVSLGPTISSYTVNVTVGDNTSSDYVQSTFIPQSQ